MIIIGRHGEKPIYPNGSSDRMNTYKVYHLGVYYRSFDTRDTALNYVHSQRSPEDFEILDNSDSIY